jgi:hypothetical protein
LPELPPAGEPAVPDAPLDPEAPLAPAEPPAAHAAPVHVPESSLPHAVTARERRIADAMNARIVPKTLHPGANAR